MTSPIERAMQVVIAGGVGFVPISNAIAEAARQSAFGLSQLASYRAKDEAFDETQWGFNPDPDGSFDEGLSQYRKDERKHVFHFRSNTEKRLHALGADTERFSHLFRNGRYVEHQLSVLGIECMAALDRILPGYAFEKQCREGMPLSRYRVLMYEKRASQSEATATPHTDRSCITLAPYETAPGFVVGRSKDSLLRVQIPQGHAAVFAGRKLSIITEGRVPALMHGTVEVPCMEKLGRRSAVYFVHTPTLLPE